MKKVRKVIWFDPELHHQARIQALKERKSLSQWMEDLISKELKGGNNGTR